MQKGGGAFTRTTVVDTVGAGAGLSLAFDAQGTPAFSYVDTQTGQLKLARAQSGGFAISDVATVAPSTDPDASIMLDAASGDATVAYYDAVENGTFLASSTGGSDAFEVTQVGAGGEGNRAVRRLADGSVQFIALDTSGAIPTSTVRDPRLPPLAPRALTSIAVGASEVDVAWHSSFGATGYRVLRSEDGGAYVDVGGAISSEQHSFIDAALSEAKTYAYRVIPFNTFGDGDPADSTIVTTPPAAPTALTAIAEPAPDVMLDWSDTSEQLSGFDLYRTSAGADAVLIAHLGPDVRTFSDTGVDGGATYTYTVVADNAGGASPASSSASATVVPDAPTNLLAGSPGSGEIDINWDPSPGAIGYRIERSDDGGRTFMPLGESVLDGSGARADTSALPGHVYAYRVVAFDVAGDGPAATIAGVATLPPMPANLLATPIGAHQITVTWDASAGESSYSLQRSVNGADWTGVAASVPADATSYVDTDVIGSSAYRYRIAAMNVSGSSEYATSTNVLTVPEAPQGLVTSAASDHDVQITWTPVNGATGYTLLRAVDGSFRVIAQPAATDTSYDDTDVAEGADYAYELVASNATGDGAASSVLAVTTPLAAPDNLAALGITSTGFTLTWADHSDAEDGFEVQRFDAVANDWVSAGRSAGAIGRGSGSYILRDLAAGSTNTFRVRAIRGATASAWSPLFDVTLRPASATAIAVSAAATSPATAQLTWNPASGNANYTVERRVAGSEDWVAVGAATTATSFTDTFLSEGTRYEYQVLSGTGLAVGASNVAAVATPLSVPEGFSSESIAADRLTLGWFGAGIGEKIVHIERFDGERGVWREIAQVHAPNTSYADTRLGAATLYQYRLYVSRGAFESDRTLPITLKTLALDGDRR